MKDLKRETEALRDGTEPRRDSDDLWQGVGTRPDPATRAILRLAMAYHRAESATCSVSWRAQERALDFFNDNGLGATLDRAEHFEARARPDATA